jgi:hypothetical protein
MEVLIEYRRLSVLSLEGKMGDSVTADPDDDRAAADVAKYSTLETSSSEVIP